MYIFIFELKGKHCKMAVLVQMFWHFFPCLVFVCAVFKLFLTTRALTRRRSTWDRCWEEDGSRQKFKLLVLVKIVGDQNCWWSKLVVIKIVGGKNFWWSKLLVVKIAGGQSCWWSKLLVVKIVGEQNWNWCLTWEQTSAVERGRRRWSRTRNPFIFRGPRPYQRPRRRRILRFAIHFL